MIFKALTLEDMEQVRLWRNQVPETLRTPYLLTKEMQIEYFYKVINNREGTTRYWGFWDEKPKVIMKWGGEVIQNNGTLIGYGGIENIQWENRTGEISLLIAPGHRKKGYGRQAVEEILRRARDELNLGVVYGECYACGPYGFWKKVLSGRDPAVFTTSLPARKYWNGKYWNSLYFTIFFHEPKE